MIENVVSIIIGLENYEPLSVRINYQSELLQLSAETIKKRLN